MLIAFMDAATFASDLPTVISCVAGLQVPLSYNTSIQVHGSCLQDAR
jgi:hypothetical protein